jgi:ABC-type lipoprotein export system ATPase subunit
VLESRLVAEGVSLAYGSGSTRVMVLRGVSLTFAPGALTLIKGPSGSGKTTLLSVLGCLLTPTAGEVLVCGQSVLSLSEREKARIRRTLIGYVFQSFRLLGVLTAFENVLVPAVLGPDVQGSSDRACQLLNRFGLQHVTNSKAKHLSFGEKQRVAIARALMNNPEIILADEPTASLDSETGLRVASTLRELADADAKTVVVVSHDERLMRFAHIVVNLHDGQIS